MIFRKILKKMADPEFTSKVSMTVSSISLALAILLILLKSI